MRIYEKPNFNIEIIEIEEIILKSPSLDNGGELDWGIGGGVEEEFPF